MMVVLLVLASIVSANTHTHADPATRADEVPVPFGVHAVRHD